MNIFSWQFIQGKKKDAQENWTNTYHSYYMTLYDKTQPQPPGQFNDKCG